MRRRLLGAPPPPMSEIRRWAVCAAIGAAGAVVLGASLWAGGGDARSGLVLGLSGWPFLVVGTWVVLRYRGRETARARERAGSPSDAEWATVQRAVRGKEVPADPALRGAAVGILRRAAGFGRGWIVLALLMSLLAVAQTVLAVLGESWFSAVVGWFVAASMAVQALLARGYGRRADHLEAVDAPASPI